MQIWNDFINRPEEDQEEILKGIRDLNVDYAEEDEEEEDFEDLKDESAGILNEVKDQRTGMRNSSQVHKMIGVIQSRIMCMSCVCSASCLSC